MHIGIDYRPALSGTGGGIAVYVRELTNALCAGERDDRYELYGHRLRGTSAPRVLPPNARLHRSRVPARAMALAARAGLGADRVLGGVDVVHWTDFVPLRTARAPVVATIHDVLFDELPDCYTPEQRERLAAVTRRIVSTARALIVPAPNTREALVRRYGADAARIHVIPHGVTALPASDAATEHGRYVLCVGTLEPRKNHLRLLAAFDRLHLNHPDVRLVVAGARGWLDEDVVAAMRAREHVVYEGAVDDARLAALYRGALALAYVSLGEGFGLPVLEAMAQGVPVLTGAGTACAQIGQEAVLAVDPHDEEAIHDGLERLIEDTALRETLAARGVTRAARYTWARTAERTREVYAEVVGG